MLISNQEQILAKVLLRARSLAVLALETDFKSEKGYPMDNSCHTDYTSFKVTPPGFFGGLPSYFEALWYPHLYSIRKSAKRGNCTRAEQECCIMTDYKQYTTPQAQIQPKR